MKVYSIVCHAIRRSLVRIHFLYWNRNMVFVFRSHELHSSPQFLKPVIGKKGSKSHYLKKVVFQTHNWNFLIARYIHIFTNILIAMMYAHLMSICLDFIFLRYQNWIKISVLTKTFAFILKSSTEFSQKIFGKKKT